MSEARIVKSNIIRAEIFLNCSDGSDHNCAGLRDALFDNIREVTSAETIETVGSDRKFCVTGTALVKKGKGKKLKSDIADLKVSLAKKGIKVSDSMVLLEKPIT